jgi:hypothetical protein
MPHRTIPNAFLQLAMLCATPKFVVADDWPLGMPRQVFAGFANGLRDDWRGTIDRFIALEAFGSDHMREELRMLRDAVLARGEPAAARTGRRACRCWKTATCARRFATPARAQPVDRRSAATDWWIRRRCCCQAAQHRAGCDVSCRSNMRGMRRS